MLGGCWVMGVIRSKLLEHHTSIINEGILTLLRINILAIKSQPFESSSFAFRSQSNKLKTMQDE